MGEIGNSPYAKHGQQKGPGQCSLGPGKELIVGRRYDDGLAATGGMRVRVLSAARFAIMSVMR
jgi:hypothetical protein